MNRRRDKNHDVHLTRWECERYRMNEIVITRRSLREIESQAMVEIGSRKEKNVLNLSNLLSLSFFFKYKMIFKTSRFFILN